MSNFNQNGINFTIANNFTSSETNHPIKGKLVSLYNDYEGYEQDDASKLINAVEIDWNGAVLPNNDPETAGDLTISTTGELHRVIIKTGSPMWAN